MVEIEESAAFCEITLFQKLFNESFAAIQLVYTKAVLIIITPVHIGLYECYRLIIMS